MPEKKTAERARKAKSPSTKASAYVHEEIEHVREGKHGARSAKQAIAIGLSKARRAGVKIPPPPGKKVPKTSSSRKPNPQRSQATTRALKREGSSAASHLALSKQARASAQRRGSASLKQATKKAMRTKGAVGRKQAAAKAARTRARKAA
jgi:hypothetical protein